MSNKNRILEDVHIEYEITQEVEEVSEEQLGIEINGWLYGVYPAIGMDEPNNHHQIVEFMKDYILTRSGVNYNETDFPIAFQNFIEKAPVKKYRND